MLAAVATLLVLVMGVACSDKKPAPAAEAPKGPKAVRKKIIMAPFPGEGVPALAAGVSPAMVAAAGPAPATASVAPSGAAGATPAAGPVKPLTAVAAAGGTSPATAGAEGLGVSSATALAEGGALSPGVRLGGGAGTGMGDLTLSYSYNPAGKVDPFKPIVKITPEGTAKVGAAAAAEQPPPLPPGTPPSILPDYDWRQLKLVAVIVQPAGGAAMAMVQDPATKKGYMITKGVRIGRTNALVTDITMDSVTVEEMVKDYVTGEWQSRPQTIPVKKTAGD